MQTKATNFRQEVDGLDRILLRGSFNDPHQFALQRPMMSFGSLAPGLDDLVGGILDREIDGHGSGLAPNSTLYAAKYAGRSQVATVPCKDLFLESVGLG